MKTLPVALAAHYQLEVTTVAQCLKVTRSDGLIFGFTETDVALVIGGVTYAPYFQPSALESTSTLAVDNMELTVLPDEAVLPFDAIVAGKWNNAAFQLFNVNYKSVADGIEILKTGTTGKVKKLRSSYVVEFRSLTQCLQQTQGQAMSINCRAQLGDVKCTKDLTAFTFTSTLTAVTDRRVFADSARLEADDYFAEGIITFNNGLNEDVSQKVKIFAGGLFTLSLPLPFLPAVGDSYTVIAGCDKTLATCIAKYNNVLNFQGEPHAPGQNKLTSPGSAQTQPAAAPVLPTEDYTGSGP